MKSRWRNLKNCGTTLKKPLDELKELPKKLENALQKFKKLLSKLEKLPHRTEIAGKLLQKVGKALDTAIET